MKHLQFAGGARIPKVPEPWLPATAAAHDFVADMSGRRDLAVKLGPGLAAAAGTAQFNPHLALIEVDTDVMVPGVPAAEVQFSDKLFQARHPLLFGALAHEAAHARFSKWMPADLAGMPGFSGQMIDVLVLLEESRIEKRLLACSRRAQTWLPAIVFDLLSRDFKISDTPYGAAATAALILARVDAGTITPEDAKPFRRAVLGVLDTTTLNRLTGLWREYHRLTFEDGRMHHSQMRLIAREWLKALHIDPDEDTGERASEGEGEGEGTGDGEAGGGKGLGEAVKAAADAASHGENMKSAERIGDEKRARREAQRAVDKIRRERGKSAAGEAFEKHQSPTAASQDGGTDSDQKGGTDRADRADGDGEGDGGHGFVDTGMASKLRFRPPTGEERGAAAIFAKALSRVLVTDRRRVKANSEVPGGRLRMRGALTRSAQKATGQRPTAEQWRHTVTAVTDEPKLRVGLLTDISGSMSDAAEPMGSTAFVVGNAVERIGGLFGSAVFGVGVYGVVAPHERIDVVPVVNPADGWENIQQGFYALDYVLDLLDGDGVKILVLATDGRLVHPEQLAFGQTMIQLCEKAGVTVLHLDFTGTAGRYDGSHSTRLGNKTPLVDVQDKSPRDVAGVLGEALIKGVRQFYAAHKQVA